MSKFKVIRFLKFLAIFIAAAFLFSFVVMHLWNWLVPDLFNGRDIDIFQAFGLLLLSKLLFSGFHGPRNHCGKREGYYWRGRLQKKLEKMTPEQREKFKEKFR